MNQNQKRILIAVVAVLVAMIAYPPFQVVGNNGIVFNMGYGWIFDPPKRGYMTATVNVSMLLIQWIGVLLIGGITFFLTKGASVPSGPSRQQSTDATPPIEMPKEKAEDLYEAILGEKNRIYYLAKFKEFDRQASGLKASWNWAAFFGFGVWALYRKMYGWFFALLGVSVLSRIFEKGGALVISIVVWSVPWVAFTIFANSIYHRSVKNKIAVAQLSIKDKPQILEFLRHKGGVHKWVIWVGWSVLVISILSILVAIAIPQFTAYKQRGYNAAAKADENTYTSAPARDLIPTSETGRDGRFVAYSTGTVLDTSTNLMWAAKDNGVEINWSNAKSYCENYRGGGYTDWRMPTQDELAGLYDIVKMYRTACGHDVHLTELIRLTCTAPWALEMRGSDAAVFYFGAGQRDWHPQFFMHIVSRALPVRSAK